MKSIEIISIWYRGPISSSPPDRPPSSTFKGGATSCTSTWWRRVKCWAQAFGKMTQPKRPLEKCEQMDRNGSETVYTCIVSHNVFRFSFNVSTLGLVYAWLFHIWTKTQWINKSTFTKFNQRIWNIRHLLEKTNPWGGPFFEAGYVFLFPSSCWRLQYWRNCLRAI